MQLPGTSMTFLTSGCSVIGFPDPSAGFVSLPRDLIQRQRCVADQISRSTP
jgi:hypothetical protein